MVKNVGQMSESGQVSPSRLVAVVQVIEGRVVLSGTCFNKDEEGGMGGGGESDVLKKQQVLTRRFNMRFWLLAAACRARRICMQVSYCTKCLVSRHLIISIHQNSFIVTKQ